VFRRVAVTVKDVMPAEIEPRAPATWIGTTSEEAERPVSAEDPADVRKRRIATLLEEVRGLGQGILVVGGVEAGELSGALAVTLARELAAEGKRVLLLDLDRESAPSRALVSDAHAAGLGDLLFGVASFTEVIHRDPGSRAHVIVVGRGVRSTTSLLTAQRLSIVIGALSQTYDFVILAAGKLAELAGAERLARFARAAILVADEESAAAGPAASDALGAKGFAPVMVLTIDREVPPTSTDRAAA
jgi:Mrp family chromosome partitioning ATPase